VITMLFLYSRYTATATGLPSATFVSHVIAAVSAGSQFQVAWLAALQMWALPAWSLGVLLFSLRLVLGYKHAFTLGRRGKPAGESIIEVVSRLTRLMGVDRRVRVLI